MSRPPGRKTVTILDAPLLDDGHGNQDRDWTGPDVSRRDVRGADVQPGSAMEYLLGRDSVLIAQFAFLPSTTLNQGITSYLHVEYKGVEYTIYGNPEVWDEGTGVDYVGLALQKWEG